MFNRNGHSPSAPIAPCALLLSLALCAGQATAQVDATWLSPQSGDWSIGTFWSGGIAPRVAGDRATIAETGPAYTVSLDIDVTLAGFTLSGGAASLQGVGGSTMIVTDTSLADASISVPSGYSSLGTLTFNGDVCDDFVDTPLDHTGSAVEWTGAGDILLGDNTVFNHGGTSVFTIRNSSTLFWNGVGTRSTLFNGPGAKIIKDSPGVSVFEDVLFTNEGAVCVLDGELQLNNVGLAVPTLQTGHWEVVGDSNLNVVGGQYDSIGGGASVLLSGAGSTFNAIDSITAINGGGSLKVQDGRNFITAGNLAVGGSLTIGDPQLAPSVFTVNGDLGNNGTVHLGSGTLFVSGVHAIGANGTFSGNGVQFGSLNNDGLISPGEDSNGPNSPGQLVVSSGIFEQSSGGRILIEIGGNQPVLDYDVFQADVAFLGGTLELLLIDGFVPQVGDAFDVFRFIERSGEFDTIEGLTQRGITFEAFFIADALRVEVVAIPAPSALGVFGLAFAATASRRRRSA